ncbi:MAG: hypothetical protein KDA98_05190, partial [Acidimicrobiales bacterium]|nr:hypothetical protein [Acidimicrobiales bacterium]
MTDRPRSLATAGRVAVAAALGVAAVAWWRRRDAQVGPGGGAPAASGGPIGPTSRTQRSAILASTATRAGGSWAADRARRVFADAERREALDEARQLKTAEQVAQTLGQLKGAMMKLGQMASYLDQGMP